MKLARYFVVGFFIIGLSGCGPSKPKDLIIGKWRISEQKAAGMEITTIVEFLKDGTVKVITEKLEDQAKNAGVKLDAPATKTRGGNYKFVDDNNFEVEIGAAGEAKKSKVKIESITKDKMVTLDDHGKKEEFTRVP